MTRSLKLFLIRHGETVDNVAQLYAGSRDSELTNHGLYQATRLGRHFKMLGVTFTHLYSSHLQRAAKTADKIREAQSTSKSGLDRLADVPDVIQLPLLREQDFGSMEGQKWNDRSGKDNAVFSGVESKDAMGKRADAFLNGHLIPLLSQSSIPPDLVIAIVSHGIFLSTLWRRLLARLPPRSVTLCLGTAAPRLSLEHLGGWSNTGYLQLHMVKSSVQGIGHSELPSKVVAPFPPSQSIESLASTKTEGDTEIQQIIRNEAPDEDEPLEAGVMASNPAHGIIQEWTTSVLTINGKDHLAGLKRTGGGVGSSRHDASQKTIEAFFKRRKME